MKSLFIAAKALKPSSNPQNAKDKMVKSENPSASVTNVESYVEAILDKTAELLIKEVSRIVCSLFLDSYL